MQQLLRDYDQEKLEQFQALMGDRRARACLTTETFGNAAALTIERAKEVYQQMIRVIAADKDQEMFERLRKERAKSAAEQARLREESVSKDTALDSLQKENNDLQIQVNAISEQHEREREKRITALRSYYQKKEHDLVVIARILILVTIVGLSAVSVLQVHILVSISVAVALSLIAHLFAPKFLRKRFSQPRARLLAFQRGAELGFSDREISEVLDSNEALNKAQF